MNIISRDTLLECLGAIEPVLATKDIVQGHKHIFYEDGHFFGFNGEAGVRTPCPELDNLVFNVKGDIFIKVVKKLRKDVKLDVLSDKLHIQSGRHKSRYTILEGEWPNYPEGEVPDEWVTAPPGFVDALKRCRAMVSKHDSRAHLCGVFVNNDYFYGSDGQYAMRCCVEGMPECDMLIGRESVDAITQLGQPDRIAVSKKSLWLDYGGTYFFTLLWAMDIAWPHHALDSIIENAQSRENVAEIDDDFIEALERIELFLPGQDLKTITIGKGDFDSGVLLLDSTGAIEEYIDWELDIPRRIGFNPELLLVALEYANTISFGSHDEPIIAHSDVLDTTCIVMPSSDGRM